MPSVPQSAGQPYGDPVEQIERFIDDIGPVNAALNVFAAVEPVEELRARAERSRRRWADGRPLSPLDGALVSVKDNIAQAGRPRRQGSALGDDSPAPVDAPVVTALEAAGLTIVGRTTMPDHGCKAVTHGGLHGTTRNPWDPALTSGGSSGGAAASVAGGLTTFSVGSDGGGSIRIPAAFCGVVGLKPTFNRVPTLPGSPFGTLSHQGPLGREVADVARLLDVLCGPRLPSAVSALDDLTLLSGLRIGLWEPTADVDPALASAWEETIRALVDAGAVVVPLAVDLSDARVTFDRLWTHGTAGVVASLGADADLSQLDPTLLELARRGSELTAAELSAAVERRQEIAGTIDGYFAECDLMVSPVTSCLPFAVERTVPAGSPWTEWHDWIPWTFPFNLNGSPAVSLPVGSGGGGLPCAVQLVGARNDDARLVGVAGALERILGRAEQPGLRVG